MNEQVGTLSLCDSKAIYLFIGKKKEEEEQEGTHSRKDTVEAEKVLTNKFHFLLRLREMIQPHMSAGVYVGRKTKQSYLHENNRSLVSTACVSKYLLGYF